MPVSRLFVRNTANLPAAGVDGADDDIGVGDSVSSIGTGRATAMAGCKISWLKVSAKRRRTELHLEPGWEPFTEPVCEPE